MSKGKALQGKDFMIFIDGKAIALSKSHVLNLTGDTVDSSTKDDGIWKDNEIGSLGWDISANGLATADKRSVDLAYDDLFDKMVKREPVEITSGIPSNITPGELPEDGWTAPSANTEGNKVYKGKAIITSLKKQGDVGGKATLDVSLQGCGELKPLEV